MLLFAGGATDSQLGFLIQRAKHRGVLHTTLLHDPGAPLLVNWDLDSGAVRVGDAEIKADAAFVRQDVFRFLNTKNPTDQSDARSWKILFDGWLMAYPEIRRFNQSFAMADAVNKPVALVWAREAGLEIPRTVLHASRDLGTQMLANGPVIYKPIGGGDECRPLEKEALDRVKEEHLPRPYIFQECLEAPELRIYRVGDRFLGFEIEADALDYRTVGNAAIIKPVQPPIHLLGPLKKLTDRIGLNFAAADFKASPNSGALKFLEVNSNPMFAGFDNAADGVLCDAMIDWLTS